MFSIKLAINFDYNNLVDIGLTTKADIKNKTYYTLTEDEQQFIYNLGYKYFDPESVNLVDSVERVIIIKTYSKDIDLEDYIESKNYDNNIYKVSYEELAKHSVVVGNWLYNKYYNGIVYNNSKQDTTIMINRQNWPILVKDTSIVFYEPYGKNRGIEDSLTTITFANEKLETGKKLRTMREMFANCGNLENIVGLDNIDTSEVYDISSMFCNCEKLYNLSFLYTFDVSNVRLMNDVFSNCCFVDCIAPLSKWNTENVISMKSMFSNTNIKDFSPIYKWNVSKVKNMSGLFELTPITTTPEIVKHWDTHNVKDMSSMFYGCYALTDLYGLYGLNIKNVKDISFMFYDCYEITDITPLLYWNYSSVEKMYNMFYNADNINNINCLLEIINNYDIKEAEDIIDARKYLDILRKCSNENALAEKILNAYHEYIEERENKYYYYD